MALNYRLTEIKDWATTCFKKLDDGSEKMNAVTDTLIWMTMIVGIGWIKPSNAEEFWWRVALIQRLEGALLLSCKQREDGTTYTEPLYLTRADVMRHIGLSTNASPLTRAQFLKQKLTHWAPPSAWDGEKEVA